jgi:hypothetical protein
MSAERKFNPPNYGWAPEPTPKFRLQDTFTCERRALDLALHECMTDYVNANALQQKTSPCHKCPIGAENRVRFAKEG